LTDVSAPVKAAAAVAAALPQFKRYREKDGKFYFKLEAHDGTLLLQSHAFDAPQASGQVINALVDAGGDGDAVKALLSDAVAADEAAPSLDAIVRALAALKTDKLEREAQKAASQ
jgi:tryptophanyl-tRNA synthetase